MQKRGDLATLTGTVSPETVSRNPRQRAIRHVALALAVAIAVVAGDQLTKWWAVERLSRGPVHVIGPVDFELSLNTGSAFSLFRGQESIIIVVVLVLIGALLVMVKRSHSASRAAWLGLIIGGALGNLSDRLFRGDHGAVVDFVALHFWPTFNVADSCIVVGCVMVAVSLIGGAREQ